MVKELELPDGRVIEFPDEATNEQMQQFIDTNINQEPAAQPEDDKGFLEGAVESVVDFAKGVGTGALELPLGIQQRVTAGLETLGAKSVGPFALASAFLADPQKVLGDPELREELLRTDISDLRQAQSAVARDIERVQKEAAERSPIAAPVGRFTAQAAQLGPLGGVPTTVAKAATTGAAIGGGVGFTQMQTQDIQAEQELLKAGTQAAIGGSLGAVTGGGLQKVTQNAPALANKIASFADQVPAKISRGFAKLASVNPQAARDLATIPNAQTLAAISDSPSVRIFDRFLSRFPGSAGKIEKNTDDIIAGIQNRLDTVGSAQAVTKQEAGEVLTEGIKGFVKRFKATSDKVYNRLDRFVPRTEPVSVSSSRKLLDDILQETAATPNLQKVKADSAAFKRLAGLVEDAEFNNGVLPYEALKRYRSLVGKDVETKNLLTGVDKELYPRVYAALSDDMRAIFNQKGPQAIQAFENANKFYTKGIEKINGTLQKVIDRGDPERVYTAALQGTKIGGTRINNIMRSLNKEEKEIVRGTVLKDLGRATPSNQGALGETFSPQTFLTNWNRVSPEAKNALFGGDATTRKSIDQVARISERLAAINRFGNPSGTADKIGMGALLIGGSFVSTPTAIGSVLGANTVARLLTNKGFVNTLGRMANKKATPGNVTNAIRQFGKVAEQNPEIAQDIAKYLTTLTIVGKAQ